MDHWQNTTYFTKNVFAQTEPISINGLIDKLKTSPLQDKCADNYLQLTVTIPLDTAVHPNPNHLCTVSDIGHFLYSNMNVLGPLLAPLIDNFDIHQACIVQKGGKKINPNDCVLRIGAMMSRSASEYIKNELE